MRTMPYWHPDFPHGTKEGNDMGCPNGGCPNLGTGRTTCRQAALATGTQMKESTMNAPVPSPPTRPLTVAPLATAIGAGIGSIATATEATPPGKAPTSSPKRLGKVDIDHPDFPHGTVLGYQKGCHKDSPCPAEPTCTEAKLAKMRAYHASKKSPAATVPAAPAPTEPEEAPTMTEATTSERSPGILPRGPLITPPPMPRMRNGGLTEKLILTRVPADPVDQSDQSDQGTTVEEPEYTPTPRPEWADVATATRITELETELRAVSEERDRLADRLKEALAIDAQARTLEQQLAKQRDEAVAAASMLRDRLAIAETPTWHQLDTRTDPASHSTIVTELTRDLDQAQADLENSIPLPVSGRWTFRARGIDAKGYRMSVRMRNK